MTSCCPAERFTSPPANPAEICPQLEIVQSREGWRWRLWVNGKEKDVLGREMTMKNKRNPASANGKTFLVLPLVEDKNAEVSRTSGLRLFTKTWQQPKIGQQELEIPRPLTATLEKPQILDIRLLGKIDMSLFRKEFLPLDLCRKTEHRRKTACVDNRRKVVSGLPKKISLDEGKLEKKKSQADVKLKCSPKLKSLESAVKIFEVPAVRKLDAIGDVNNNRNRRLQQMSKVRPKSSSSIKRALLPEPCRTCGRPDLPERFHSHPATPAAADKHKKKPQAAADKVVKSSVQKPVAIRFKSKAAAQQQQPESDKENGMKPAKGPKTLTCYLCAREFGTMSLPLHEPKCLQKWERENASLPVHLRRKLPVKPETPLNKEQWNKFAWEASQSSLAPCTNCGRTFYPDRLLVHQRSCKSTQLLKTSNESLVKSSPIGPSTVQCDVCGKLFGTKSIRIHQPQCLKRKQTINECQTDPSRVEKPAAAARKPPAFPCYLCGRLFGPTSIYIHEPQCLKKWHIENDKLPAGKRRPVPQKPEIKFTQYLL